MIRTLKKTIKPGLILFSAVNFSVSSYAVMPSLLTVKGIQATWTAWRNESLFKNYHNIDSGIAAVFLYLWDDATPQGICDLFNEVDVPHDHAGIFREEFKEMSWEKFSLIAGLFSPPNTLWDLDVLMNLGHALENYSIEDLQKLKASRVDPHRLKRYLTRYPDYSENTVDLILGSMSQKHPRRVQDI